MEWQPEVVIPLTGGIVYMVLRQSVRDLRNWWERRNGPPSAIANPTGPQLRAIQAKLDEHHTEMTAAFTRLADATAGLQRAVAILLDRGNRNPGETL